MDFHLDDDQLALQDHVARLCRERWPLERIAERPTGAFDRAGWDALRRARRPFADARGARRRARPRRRRRRGRVRAARPPSRARPARLDRARRVRDPGGRRGRAGWPAASRTRASRCCASSTRRRSTCSSSCARAASRASIARSSRRRCPPTRSIRTPASASSPRCPPARASPTPRARASFGPRARCSPPRSSSASRRPPSTSRSRTRSSASSSAVPIGSFQALKHLMADMYVRADLARSATYAAAAVLDDPAAGDLARSAGAAKLLAGEAAVENARGRSRCWAAWASRGRCRRTSC